MARLRLTICGEPKDLVISTQKETDSASFVAEDGNSYEYQLSLIDFSFKKKMYQPTEIIAKIQLTKISGKKDDWKAISRDGLDSIFKFKKVVLEEMPTDLKDTTVNQTIGNDFYVHEVLAHFKPDAMYVTLKIYSLDKLLTLKQTSRTFVAKKLSADILATELTKYVTPWTIDPQIGVLAGKIEDTTAAISKLEEALKANPGNQKNINEKNRLTTELENLKTEKTAREKKQEKLTHFPDNMKHLYYDNSKSEHIFPYLVQYNESFYDMLIRTANRWGEFVYYENGNLNIGYEYDANKVVIIKDGYSDMTYVDLDSTKAEVAQDGKFDYTSADEQGFLSDMLIKSPGSVSGILFKPGKKGDKVAMKLISSFLRNEKNLPTYLADLAFNSTYELVVSELANLKVNKDYDKKWFPDQDKPCTAEHYGKYDIGTKEKPDNRDSVNLFSEMGFSYTSEAYTNILAKEQSVGKNAVCINFDTHCPKLQLGSIIKVSEKEFIVVEISAKTVIDYELTVPPQTEPDDKSENDLKGNVVIKTPISTLVFQVVATAQDSEDKLFYPAVIPAGHVRQADPQIATITDADDPAGKNRVRVMFSWQDIAYEGNDAENDITDATKKASSPWLTFAAGGAGSPVIGKHYEKNKVLVGFIGGNVERPYVLGGLTSEGDGADYVQTTPGGHTFTMQDDEEGVANFLTGMFLPGVGTLLPTISLIPGFNSFKEAVLKPSKGCKNNIALGGGFELSDKYGIYKISGSTDGREVSIASPWGAVNISAFTGINISAPNGDISISGKNVSIEAGNNLQITSGTNVQYKLLGESLDKGAKNVASAFFGNMAAAVTKKLALMAVNIVDLSMIRNVLDIVFRPAEGNMRIKSNRYMMLESGDGECDYPKDAYKDDNTVKEVIKKKEQAYLRPGLKLDSGVVEMIAKVQNLGNKIDLDYRTAYNKCVDLREAYEKLYEEAIKYSEDYDSTKSVAENAKICNRYDAIKDIVWKDDPEITEANLGWQANYTVDPTQVKDKALSNYRATLGSITSWWNTLSDQEQKEAIVNRRNYLKEKLLSTAISLQKAIADLQKMSGLSEEDIKAQIGAWKDRNIPESFRKALVTAFKKEKLGDTFFYKKITDDEKKKLDTPYGEDGLKKERKALKRKAAIILLEEMGFIDEWRRRIPDSSVPPIVSQVNVVAGNAPGIPPAPQRVKDVPRKTNEADLTDDYWGEYVQSLAAVPPLTPVRWKAAEEAKKMLFGALDNLYVWKNIKENQAWGDAKKGAILFSSDESVYHLKNNTIEEVNIPGKENLTETDDTVANGPVNSFLTKIRAKLNDLN